MKDKEENKPFKFENYNYKCPCCKGEFTYPVYHLISASATMVTYHCPFCNMQMKGF